MLQSNLFTKTLKESPKDEVSANAKLLIRGGFIHKDMAGVYSFLPLGLRVLDKINAIIREEMNAIGGQEVYLASLQNKEMWEPTNQWDDKEVDVWFKTALKNGTELGLALTHEAPITKLMSDYVNSYRDLPKYLYQFQTKFRNETRAKSGIMRLREFIMKDLYSFSKDQAEHEAFYEAARQSYIRIFDRLGIGEYTYYTAASGGVFSKFSHEFQTITDAGEDTIYVDEAKKLAINKEIYADDVIASLGLDKASLVEKKAAEVGNIFTLGTRFSDALGLMYADENGDKKPVIMGSYGIGPARMMGTIVELFADANGIIWPQAIAPFTVHLLALGISDEVMTAARAAYGTLENNGIDVLFDDREGATNGQKFADADLIGCPWRLIVSEKMLADGAKVELKARSSENSERLTIEEAISKIQHVQ